MKRPSLGFTLVEVIVVISILSILALIVAVEFREIQPRARDTERKADITTISVALEKYFQTNGEYPSYYNMRDNGSSLLKIDKQALVSPSDNVNSGGTGANGQGTSITPLNDSPSSEDIARYIYWVPGEDSLPGITPDTRDTFILGYLQEQGSYGDQGTRVYMCGRGNNVNTAKTHIAASIAPGAARGKNNITPSVCSNF